MRGDAVRDGSMSPPIRGSHARCRCASVNHWWGTFVRWVQQQRSGRVLPSGAVVVTSGRRAAAMWVENVLCFMEVSHVARCCRMQRPCFTLEGEY